MPIVIRVPDEVKVDQTVVDAVMRLMKEHCAPTTYDRFASSLEANDFPFTVTK